MIFCLYLTLLLSVFGTVHLDDGFDVIWTDQPEAEILTEEEHKVAFRDVVIEGMARQFFKVYMEACRLGPNKSHIPDHLMMKDPQVVKDVIHFKKQQKGLVDVEFKAWNLKLGGLHNLEIENLHVVRHIGLKDIRLMGQVVTDISFTGEYEIKGSGLSMVDLSGSGKLNMDVSKLMLTGETYLILRENQISGSKQLYIKNVNLKMKNEKMKIELENLLGGGFVGDMANEILTLIGEDFLYAHKDTLATIAKDTFKRVFGQLLDLELLTKSEDLDFLEEFSS